MPRLRQLGAAFALAGLIAAAGSASASGRHPIARVAGQSCHFAFVHRVLRAAHHPGWAVTFGATISCAQTPNRLELGGNLVSWGTIKDCPSCGHGWFVTSAMTPYVRVHGRRSLTVTRTWIERRRRNHKVWVTFAVAPVGPRLYGFRDTNPKPCLIGSGGFYSCDGFSAVFH